MTRAYVGLGSNLGEREANVHKALVELNALPGTKVVGISHLRETDPVGIQEQPRFLNGVAAVETTLDPRELLERLLEIEAALGRDRSGVPKGGPRVIDLDLLLYGDRQIEEPGLQVPHPRLAERRFVLEPLGDLDPALDVPGKGAVETLISELDSGP